MVETPGFVRDAKAAGMTDEERQRAVDTLAADPLAGAEMEGTGGARKVRIAKEGRGKSGGYRVITYFGGWDVPVFLLNVFAKGERTNLSKGERNELRKVLGDLAEACRSGARRNVEGR